MNGKRLVVGLVVVLVGVVLRSRDATPRWQSFSPPDGAYSVEMPAKPGSKDVDGVTGWGASVGKAGYLVFHRKTSGPMNMNYMDDLARAMGFVAGSGSVTSEMIDGYSCKTFSFTDRRGHPTTFKIFNSLQHEYVVATVADDTSAATALKPSFDRFYGSFKVR